MILTEKLANEATLLLEPVDRTDTLCIGFWFLHGSRDEGSGEWGYSHFLEHMIFKGTTRRTALAIAQDIDRVGGFINAFTEKEATCVYVILPKEHVRLAFDVLSDMAVNSLLDPVELAKEKEVIVNEIRSVDDSPEEKGHDRYLMEMWGDHPLARKITGDVADVEKTDRDSLERFYRGRFVPSNTVIAVAGSFDVQEVRDLSAAAFPTAGKRTHGPRRTVPVGKPTIAVVPDRFNQAQIYAGTCYPIDHDITPYYTSLIFSTAFGESMSSRLFQKLREEQGLCYTVYSFRTFFSDLGMWTIYGNATPKLAGKLLEGIDAELGRLATEPLSEKEIADAKSHLIGSMILSREDMETRMKRLVRQFCMMDRVLSFDESVSVIQGLGRDDAAQFAGTHLRRDSFGMLAYGCRGLTGLRRFAFAFADSGVKG